MQEIIIYVILSACVLWVGKRIHKSIKQMKEDDDPCAHCASGCDPKRMMEAKRRQCKDKSREKKKSCCG